MMGDSFKKMFIYKKCSLLMNNLIETFNFILFYLLLTVN